MLVSMGVECLYTKFSNHVSIEVIKEKPNAQIDKPIARKVVTKFLFLILTLNNFIFNSISHLQRKGHAMGTVFLPSIANIFIFIKVWIDTYLFVHQRQSNSVLTIHRWFIFHLEKNRGGTTIMHRGRQQKTPLH